MVLTGGDLAFFWPENLRSFAHLPTAWDASLNTGVGHSALGVLWINTYLHLTSFLSYVGFSWTLIVLVFWLLPSIVFSFFSALVLFRSLFPSWKKFGLLAGLIYASNTYFLMILTGGQLGFALGYSLVPLLFKIFLVVLKEQSIQKVSLFGLLLGMTMLFDPRVLYMLLLIMVVYILFYYLAFGLTRRQFLFSLFLPLLIAATLNNFWLLPVFIYRESAILQSFSSVKSFSFFSFADFSHAFSLLHPNWPENIFGKTYFLQPEFLVIPVLAYMSLLFLDKNTKKKETMTILFFAFLGIFGSFLAKGATIPFGIFNTFLFEHFPGFSLFRDSTKFYSLIALSYAVLIPFTLGQVTAFFMQDTRKKVYTFSSSQVSYVLAVLFVFYWLFLLRPIFSDHLVRAVSFRTIPNEYIRLKTMLTSQLGFFRTLWIPRFQRFGYSSDIHPAIGRGEIEDQSNPLRTAMSITRLKDPLLLQNLGVRYIIVPYDSEKEIFIQDRGYDGLLKKQIEKKLDSIPWLRKHTEFYDIGVYELSGGKDLFFLRSSSESTTATLLWEMANSSNYKLFVEGAENAEVIFSQAYAPGWIAVRDNFRVPLRKYDDFHMVFNLSGSGSQTLYVEYIPQRYTSYGLGISIVCLFAIVTLQFMSAVKKKKYILD